MSKEELYKKIYALEGYKRFLKSIPLYAIMSLALTIFSIVMMVDVWIWWAGLVLLGLGLGLCAFVYFLWKFAKKKVTILQKEIDELTLYQGDNL